MIIIGLTGRAGSGKDTVADHLVFNYGFVKLSLAAPLKNGIASIFGLPMELMEDRELKEKVIDWIGKSPRQLLQTLGTEWGRTQVAGDIWLRVAQHRIELIERNAKITGIKGVVISDVRFENEAEWLRGQGQLIHVVRPGHGLRSAATARHISEAGILAIAKDETIINDRGLIELRQQVDTVIGFDL